MPFAMGFVVVWPQPRAAHAAPAAAISGVPRAMFDWDRDHCPGRRGVFETGGGCANDVQTGCDPDVTDAPVKAFSESCFSLAHVAPASDHPVPMAVSIVRGACIPFVGFPRACSAP
jgi:hypothetical protein